MIIALDGPAGVGKSTIAQLLSKRNNLFYLNSGNFYRAVTLYLLESHGDPENQNDIISAAKAIEPSIIDNTFYLNGSNVEAQLHSDSVDKWVATHSAIPEVRSIVNKKMKTICEGKDLVCEGRDMTTVLFPTTPFKFYLDASACVRAKRRFNQGVSNLSLEEIEKSIIDRDTIDKNKTIGSLSISKDANYIDTSNLTIDEVCLKIEETIKGMIPNKNSI